MPGKDKEKISLTSAVLQKLAEFGEGTLDAFFPPQYPYAALWRPLLGLERAKKVKKETVSTILWRLKRQGLVESRGSKKPTTWHLTKAGEKHMADMSLVTERKSDGIMRLVIFDVPERERRKRDTLRAELIGCGFRPLQKSVWMGDYPITEDFINLIDELELAAHVYIFSVRERGTIPSISVK